VIDRVRARVAAVATSLRGRRSSAWAGRRLHDVGEARDRALEQPSHDTRTTSILGIALGVSFTICFLTGMLSHLIQHPPGWFHYPARPAGLYRLTQGVHVATGTAAVPLLLAKLWAASPRLIQWPPVRSIAHLLERVSVLPLVAGSIFMLFSGLADAAKWYPYPFSFVPAHYAVAWITFGALVVHIGAKVTVARDALRRGPAPAEPAAEPVGRGRWPALSRRGFLGATATGVGLITVATVGQTVEPLAPLSGLAPRRPDAGPEHLPVNRTAREAGVVTTAQSDTYRLTVSGNVTRPMEFTLAQLEALPRHEATLPIACVEGWSASARWRGIRVRDLLDAAGAHPDATVVVSSLQTHGSYASSVLDADHAHDRDTLLALEVRGERLDLDHGYPLRLIAPNRPGVMQTKWVDHLEVR
jgi:DMSO/TMAO reductase YedYZ molybdopterin-dependent catalytic subunit